MSGPSHQGVGGGETLVGVRGWVAVLSMFPVAISDPEALEPMASPRIPPIPSEDAQPVAAAANAPMCRSLLGEGRRQWLDCELLPGQPVAVFAVIGKPAWVGDPKA